jgi:hypothetical protein
MKEEEVVQVIGVVLDCLLSAAEQKPPTESESKTEADHIVSLVANKHGHDAFSLVAQQINVTHGHATSLLQLAAILSAISAAILPQLSAAPLNARIATMTAFIFVLGAAFASATGVLRPTWVTKFKPSSAEKFELEMVQNAIKIRGLKSFFVRIAALLLMAGLVVYAAGAYYVLFSTSTIIK